MATFSTLKNVPWHPLKFPKSVVPTDKDVTVLFYRPKRVWSDAEPSSQSPIHFAKFRSGRNRVHHMDLEEQDKVEAINVVAHRINANDVHNQPQNSSMRNIWSCFQAQNYNTRKEESCFQSHNSSTGNSETQTNNESRTRGHFHGFSTKSDGQATNNCVIDAATQTEGREDRQSQVMQGNYTINIRLDNPSGPVFIGDKCRASTVTLYNLANESDA